MNLGSDLADQGGKRGSFFTGVLAVVVASPCTAPFMGTALGFALTQSTPLALAIFAALGAGMATPLLLLSYSEWARRRLPRPGAWMETLKQGAGIPALCHRAVAILGGGPSGRRGLHGRSTARSAAPGAGLVALAGTGRIQGHRRHLCGRRRCHRPVAPAVGRMRPVHLRRAPCLFRRPADPHARRRHARVR